MPFGIQPRAYSQEMLNILIIEIGCKIPHLKLLLYLSRENDWNIAMLGNTLRLWQGHHTAPLSKRIDLYQLGAWLNGNADLYLSS